MHFWCTFDALFVFSQNLLISRKMEKKLRKFFPISKFTKLVNLLVLETQGRALMTWSSTSITRRVSIRRTITTRRISVSRLVILPIFIVIFRLFLFVFLLVSLSVREDLHQTIFTVNFKVTILVDASARNSITLTVEVAKLTVPAAKRSRCRRCRATRCVLHHWAWLRRVRRLWRDRLQLLLVALLGLLSLSLSFLLLTVALAWVI